MGKLLLGVLVTVFLVLGLMALGLSTSLSGGGPPSTQAQRDIPAAYLPLYQAGADSCPGLPWSVLAAIGKVESDHGRSTAPGVTSGANFAAAAGPTSTTRPTPSSPPPTTSAATAPPGAPTWPRRCSPTTTPTGTSPRCWPSPPATPRPGACRPARPPRTSPPRPCSLPTASSATPTSGARPASRASTTALD